MHTSGSSYFNFMVKAFPLTIKRWIQNCAFVIMGIGMGLLTFVWRTIIRNRQVKFGIWPVDKLLLAGRALWFYFMDEYLLAFNLHSSYVRWQLDTTIRSVYLARHSFSGDGLYVAVAEKDWERQLCQRYCFFVTMLFPILGSFALYICLQLRCWTNYHMPACIGRSLVSGGEHTFIAAAKNQRVVPLSQLPSYFAYAGNTYLARKGRNIFEPGKRFARDTLRKIRFLVWQQTNEHYSLWTSET